MYRILLALLLEIVSPLIGGRGLPPPVMIWPSVKGAQMRHDPTAIIKN